MLYNKYVSAVRKIPIYSIQSLNFFGMAQTGHYACKGSFYSEDVFKLHVYQMQQNMNI